MRPGLEGAAVPAYVGLVHIKELRMQAALIQWWEASLKCGAVPAKVRPVHVEELRKQATMFRLDKGRGIWLQPQALLTSRISAPRDRSGGTAQIAWSAECRRPANAAGPSFTYLGSHAWLAGCRNAPGRTSLLVFLFCAGLMAPMLSSVPYAAGSSVPPKLIGCPRFSVTRTYWGATHTRFSML